MLAGFPEYNITSTAGGTTVNSRATVLEDQPNAPITIMSWQADGVPASGGTPPSSDKPVADFFGVPTFGGAPLDVQFFDTSQNGPTYWYWDFGDTNIQEGDTELDQNPPHKYGSPGRYTVTLIATNGIGSSTNLPTQLVTVNRLMWVKSINVKRVLLPSGKWEGEAKVLVLDENDQKVDGSTVAGFFNAPNTNTQTGDTNGSSVPGVATISSDRVNAAPPNWCFAVTGISLVDATYVPGAKGGVTTGCETGGLPPLAPTLLTATAGDGSVSLDWDDNTETDLAGYRVKRSTATGGPYFQIASATASDYIDTTATNGTTYYYVVTAVNTSGNESLKSNENSATPNLPGPPTFVSAEVNGTSLVVTFSEKLDATSLLAASDFTVTGSQTVSNVVVGGTTVTLTLTPGVAYDDSIEVSYKEGTTSILDAVGEAVVTFNPEPVTNITSDLTLPAAPTGLAAVAGDGLVSLGWDKNTEADLDGYNVYRATASIGPYTQVNVSLVPGPSYTDTTVFNSTTCYYEVAAVDTSANESMVSGWVLATPQAGVGVTVSSITPSSMQRGETIPATISGSGFVSGASVAFENGSCGKTPTATVTSVSPDGTTISATVNHSGGGAPKTCVWDLRVTNPDTSSDILVGGFTVTP